MIPILVVLTLVVIYQSIGGPSQQETATGPTELPTVQSAASPPAGDPNAPSSPADPALPAGALTTAVSESADTASSVTTAAPAEAAAPVAAEPTTPGAVPDLTIKDAKGHPAGGIAAGALPAGAEFVKGGAGVWHVVPGTTPRRGGGPQRFTYTVEVENGLQDGNAGKDFAAAVDATLADPRSWIGGKQFSLQRVDKGEPDFRVSLTSQMTVRAGCGFDIPLEASCFNGAAGRVFINDARWTRGALSYDGDLDAYRAYAVNHEVGHALGMRHEPCPKAGAPAPVMMQQSWSVSNDDLNVLDPQTIPKDGKVCRPNPYPFPAAAAPPGTATDPSAAAG